MAIAFKASYLAGSTNTSTSATASIILADASNGPYSLQQGDFCIMFWAASDDNNRTTAFQNRRALDGTWSVLQNELYTLDGGSPDNNITIGLYYKVQGSTPDTTIPIPNVSGTNMAVTYGMFVFSGVDTATIIDAATPTTGANGGRPNPGAATPLAAGNLMAVFAAASNGSTTGASFVPAADLSTTTNHWRTTNQNGSSKDCTAGMGLHFSQTANVAWDPAAWTGSTTDSDSCWASFTISLVAAKPVISPVATNQNQVENSAFSQTYTADMAVTWSIVGGTDSGKFSIGSGTGTLTMPAKDYEAPDDANGDRVYGVTIRADAGGGLYTDKAVTVTITNQNAPTITPATFAHNVAHNTAFSFDYLPNTATWSLVGGADQARFAITSPAGLLSMTAKDFFNPIDSNADNVYNVTIRAASTEGNTDQAVTVTVQRPIAYPTSAVADNTGTATGSWANLTNLYADDAAEATHGTVALSAYTDIVTCSGYDLSWLPDGSSILGIEVITELSGDRSSGTNTHQFNFAVKGSGFVRATGYILGRDLAANQVVTLGGPTDTWGLSGADLTGAGLKSSFNIQMYGQANSTGSGSGQYDVDYVGVRIYFNPATVLTSTDIATSAAQVTQATLMSWATLSSQTVATSAPAISIVSLGQKHNLTDIDLATFAPGLTSSAIGQKHNFTASTLATPGVSITQAVFGQRHVFSAGILATPIPVISQSAITSFAALVTTTLATPAPSITQAVFGQKHILTVGMITVSTGPASITNASLAVVRLLTSTNLATSAPSITSATLGVIRVLTSTNVATPAALISNATIGQKHNIADIDVVTSAPAISSATFGQKHIMATQNVATFQPVIAQVAALGIVNFIAQNISTPAALISNATIVVIPTVVKIIRPESTPTPGTWTDQLGGTDLAGAMDEAVANDADYAQSAPSVSDTCRIKLASLQATEIYAPAKLRYRLKRSGAPAPTQKVRLYSGGSDSLGSGTLVGQWTHTVDNFTTYEQDVNAALIDPAQPLYVELEAA